MGTRQTRNIFKLLTSGKALVVLLGLEGLRAAALLAQLPIEYKFSAIRWEGGW